MSIYNKFSDITKEYDNKLYIVFKEIIDQAIKEADNKKMDSIMKFIYVNSKLESAYVELALALGIISDNNSSELPKRIDPPISENLLERIYEYINPIIESAKMRIKQKAEYVLQSSNLLELKERYTDLMKILSADEIQENSYLIEDIDFDENRPKIK